MESRKATGRAGITFDYRHGLENCGWIIWIKRLSHLNLNIKKGYGVNTIVHHENCPSYYLMEKYTLTITIIKNNTFISYTLYINTVHSANAAFLQSQVILNWEINTSPSILTIKP